MGEAGDVFGCTNDLEELRRLARKEAELRSKAVLAVYKAEDMLEAKSAQLASLRSENEKLRAALGPFANVADKFQESCLGSDPDEDDHEIYQEFVEEDPAVDSQVMVESEAAVGLRLSDFARAKACITGSQTEEPSSATRTDQPDGEDA